MIIQEIDIINLGLTVLIFNTWSEIVKDLTLEINFDNIFNAILHLYIPFPTTGPRNEREGWGLSCFWHARKLEWWAISFVVGHRPLMIPSLCLGSQPRIWFHQTLFHDPDEFDLTIFISKIAFNKSVFFLFFFFF